MSEDFAELRDVASIANNELAEAGLVVAAFGNASEVDRSAGVFAIKPSGIPCGAVVADDMVVVTIEDGSVVWGPNRPSADTPTHRLIYAGLDGVGGVAHTHSLCATAWAQAQTPIPCLGTTHADHFSGSVPVTRPLTDQEIVGEYEANTGMVIVELFEGDGADSGDIPGALVASHGPFAWGASAAEAVANAAALELVAELATLTLEISPSQGPIQDSLLHRHFSRKHGPSAYYGQP